MSVTVTSEGAVATSGELRPAWSEAFAPDVLTEVAVPRTGFTRPWAFDDATFLARLSRPAGGGAGFRS